METGTGIRLGVLGPLEVTCDGRPVRLAAAKQRVTLAALLAYAGRPVSSDRLVAYLWEESPPVSARGALQTHIARLRRALGDTTGASPRTGATGAGGPVALIETVGEGYVLRADPDTLDAERFRELARQAAGAGEAEDLVQESALLREALDLWRGPVLADVPSEPLRREVAPRLEEERLRLLERWFELELRAGRHQELVLRLRTATSEHPLRERLWEQLMIALRRSGRRAEALEVYHQVAGLLRDELGIDPGSGLRRLHRAVLNDDRDPHTAAERGLAPEVREEDTTSATGTVARRGTAPHRPGAGGDGPARSGAGCLAGGAGDLRRAGGQPGGPGARRHRRCGEGAVDAPRRHLNALCSRSGHRRVQPGSAIDRHLDEVHRVAVCWKTSFRPPVLGWPNLGRANSVHDT
jgi:DNA-binding SARP family transcriptional activator